jgi:N-acetylmuramoyl-L-alanine amidase
VTSLGVMRFRSLLVAAGVSTLLAGCGSDNDKLIPQSDADQLSSLVAEAGDASAAGECDAAQQAVQQAEQQLSGLPRATDRALKRNLRDWLDHLNKQIGEQCTAEPEETPTVTPTEAPTETATPEPTATETATPSPSPSPTASPEPTVTVDPGTGGEQAPEEPEGSGGVAPEEDG